MIHALVVGANGFIGKALVNALLKQPGWRVRCAARKSVSAGALGSDDYAMLPEDPLLMPDSGFDQLMQGIDVVYFLAAATPGQLRSMLKPRRQKALADNADMPLTFAKAAKRRGVRRFVFVSSCNVHGGTTNGLPFSECSPYVAQDDYAASKIAAEKALLAAFTDISELVIVRPPMVYGPGSKSPVRHLLWLVRRGIPLPLGSLNHNRRKMIGLSNLVDFLRHVGIGPKCADEIFLVADNEELSTAAFLRLAGEACGRSAILPAVPLGLLEGAAGIFGKGSQLQRLIGDYQIDDIKCRTQLNWTAPYSVSDELRRIYEHSKA